MHEYDAQGQSVDYVEWAIHFGAVRQVSENRSVVETPAEVADRVLGLTRVGGRHPRPSGEECDYSAYRIGDPHDGAWFCNKCGYMLRDHEGSPARGCVLALLIMALFWTAIILTVKLL